MARSLNKKYFGNRNIGSASTTADDKIGGEGVASVAVTGTFAGKTTATAFTVPVSVIGTPNLPGGVKATMTITFSSATAGTVTVTEGGSGYTAVPTISGAGLQALGGGSGTVVLTATLAVDTGAVGSSTNQENAIIITAYIPGGSSAVTGDIIKQVSGRRYKVKTAHGTGIVKLVASAPAAGEASIIATDAASGTYYVTKITAHKAVLTQATGTVYATGAATPWTFGTATSTVCKITNA